MNEDLTVERAKQIAMSTERDIAALVPAQFVSGVEQNETGILLSCEADRGYQWTGQTRVLLQGAPDMQVIIDGIVDAYAQREAFTARAETAVDGEPSAHVLGEFGAGYLATRSVDATKIEILSFSPCFRLPEDKWAGDTY